MKTGLAPQNNTEVAVEANVIEGIITSSSSSKPIDLYKACKAVVPLLKETAYSESQYSEILPSNSSTAGPEVKKLDLKVFSTLLMSFSDIDCFPYCRKELLTGFPPSIASL